MSMETENSKKEKKPALHYKVELYDRVALKALLVHPDVADETKALLKKYPKVGKDTASIGQLKVEYSHAIKGPDKDDGRVYANKGSQGIWKDVRAELGHRFYYDIDIVCAHPTLILHHAIRNKWEHRFLKAYVEHRDTTLESVKKYYNVERFEAKQLFNALVYGGGIESWELENKCARPKGPMPALVKLRDELQNIMYIVWNEHRVCDTFKKDASDHSKMRTNMAAWVGSLEYSALKIMDSVASEMGESPDVLMHDGVMIRKRPLLDQARLDEVMRAMEARIKDTLKYDLKLVEKPMERNLNMATPIAPPVVADFDLIAPDVIVDDRWGAKKLVEFANGRLVSVGGKTFSYVRGLWSNESFELDKLIEEFADRMVFRQVAKDGRGVIVHNFGGSTTALEKMIKRIAVHCYDEGFFERLQGTGAGKVLFEDGVYDFESDTFTPGFDMGLLFYYRINRPYCPQATPDSLGVVLQVLNDMFPDSDFRPTHERVGEYVKEEYVRYFFISLARALAGGVANGRRFYFVPGTGGAGKSLLISILCSALGGYVGTFTIDSLRLNSRSSADPAAKKAFLVNLAHRRLALSSETTDDSSCKLDAGLIKTISGNDRVEARTVFKDATSMKLECTVFGFVNDIPAMSQFDASSADRIRTIEFRTKFVDVLSDPSCELERLRDKTLDSKFESSVDLQNAVFHVLRDAYRHFKIHGHVEPSMVRGSTNAWIGQESSFLARFNQIYMESKDSDEYVTTEEIQDAFEKKFQSKHSKQWIKQEMSQVTWAVYSYNIKNLLTGSKIRGFRFVEAAE
jgi:hypothetical protein